jgi:hypothetical protein
MQHQCGQCDICKVWGLGCQILSKWQFYFILFYFQSGKNITLVGVFKLPSFEKKSLKNLNFAKFYPKFQYLETQIFHHAKIY